MSRKILDRLSDPTLVAVRVVGDEWPRSFVSATVVPDQWVGLIERRDGGRRLVPAGEDPRPERSDKLLLVRTRPVAVSIHVDGARSSDQHDVSGVYELSIRWQPRDDDLAALGRTLLEPNELSLDGLAKAVADAGGRSTLEQFIRARPASDLVRGDLCAALLEALHAQMKRFLFSSGMGLECVATLELSSTSLAECEALERETAARVERVKSHEMVEQAARAAASRRLDDMRALLDKLKTAAENDSGYQWHELLPSLTPAERGQLLANLWRITPDQHTAEAVVVVAGRECVWIDPAEPKRIIRRVSVDDSLGGLRSVAFSGQENALLVGAARGVWVLDADAGDVHGQYEVPGADRPRTGFNAVVLTGDRLFATHSQLGAWCWPLGSPQQAEALLEPAAGAPRAIRAVTAAADGRVLFAADDVVHVLTPDGAERATLPPTPGAIQCLATEGVAVFVGTSGGCLALRDVDGTGEWRIVHRASAAFESIFPRRWGDLLELVIPAGIAGVCGVYAQEGVVARLMETRVPVRRVYGCDDLLVALNDNRDRLIVMRSDAARRGGHEVPVRRMLGHSVQDACIVLRNVKTEEESHTRSDQVIGAPSDEGVDT